MPQTKSAKKALRQSYTRHRRNLGHKRKIKDVTKKFKKLVADGKLKEAQAELPHVYKILDKVAKVGYIKRGRANRLKSRLTKKLGNRK